MIETRLLRKARRRGRDDGQGGAAMVEFAVVFPVQLFVTLALMQLALYCLGHILVGHAAWAAARAALVRDLPLTDGGSSGASAQKDAATDAAALILSQVVPADYELQNASGVIDSTGQNKQWTPPADLDQKLQLGPSNAYTTNAVANHKTGAYCLLTDVSVDPGDVAGDDYTSVRLTFQFPLVIPVVNKWFAQWGPYAIYGVTDDNLTAGSPRIDGTEYWYPVITISKTGFVPRGWKK